MEARPRASRRRRMVQFKYAVKKDLLTIVIILGVVLGMVTGIIVRLRIGTAISKKTSKYLGFPGEILLRMLRFIAIPLIMTCIICALGSMNIEVSKQISWQIIVLVFATQASSVGLAMVLTAVINPGKEGSDKKSEENVTDLERSTIPDVFLDLMRNIVPDNAVSVYLQQYRTKIRKPDEYTDNNLLWPFEKIYDRSINLLGIIVLAIIFGLCLPLMKVKSRHFMTITKEVYLVSMQLTTWILWTAPIFLFFLIMTEIMKIHDMSIYFSTWGIYGATCIVADFFIILIIDPILLYIFTRSNPFRFYADMVKAYLTAFGTASSLAAMPVLIECLLKHGVDERLVRFVVPIIVNTNKDGTAVFLAASSVFAAQLMTVNLGIGQYLSIFVLASLGSIGTAGVPFSSIVILLMILSALALDQSLIGTFIAMDWLIDRFTTLTNIVSNSVVTKALEKWNQRLLQDLP